MPQRRTRTGSTKASESASKASKNVALPMTRRARRCQRENGIASRRALRSPCATPGTSQQLADDTRDGHPEGRQVGAQINVAEQRARRSITVEIVGDEHVGGALQSLGVT